MANYDEICKATKASVDAYLETARKALKDKDFDAYENAKVDLEDSVSKLNKATRNCAYAGFVAQSNPLIAAIRQFYVTSYRVKEERGKEGESEGKIVNINVMPNDKTRIDVSNFIDFALDLGAEMDRTWLHDCAALLALLQIRKTDIYTLKHSDLASESYYFVEAFKKKKAGETPDSNTKIVAMLQKIVDEAIAEEDENGGKKTYKCTHRDIAFIEDCAHQFDPKAKAGIKSLKVRGFQTVMVSVLYKMLTGENYTVRNFVPKGNDA